MFISLAFLCAPWLLFFWQLWSELTINPTYQFAMLAPFIIGYLVWERCVTALDIPSATRVGIEGHSPSKILPVFLILGIFLLLPLRLLFEANADWRLILWLQGGMTALVTLGGLYLWGGVKMMKSFAALALLPLLCIPWPTVFEKEISTSLMSSIASVAVEAVHLVGFSAQRAGNLIFLSNGTTVGVEEACSGIRSLAGNLFAAGVIGELLSLTFFGRGMLFVFGFLTALVFNFLRSLILVLTAATAGSQWALLLHDTAGWSILVVSFVSLYLMARLLPKEEAVPVVANSSKDFTLLKNSPLPLWLCFAGLATILFSEPLVALYYPTTHAPAQIALNQPSAVGLLPAVVTKRAEDFRTMLFYNEGTSWHFHTGEGDWDLFFFHWSSPRLSRLGGAYHRPERCLPNTGWTLVGSPQNFSLKLAGGLQLPASLTHFTDASGRHATLLFSHWSDDLADIGLDTRLDSKERWEDFLHHRRLASRTALQLSLISPQTSTELDQLMIKKAQALLTSSAAR